jgi:hypothetical protein
MKMVGRVEVPQEAFVAARCWYRKGEGRSQALELVENTITLMKCNPRGAYPKAS